MDLLQVALGFNGTLVLGLHLRRRHWARALQPLICLLLLPRYPGWGLALLLVFGALQRLIRPAPSPPHPVQELSKARKWSETTESYEGLEGEQPVWVHLLACRAYARQARFPEALQSLRKTRLAPPQLPPHYACMTLALTGSSAHLEAWLPRSIWPEHSKLHARALCQGRAGNLEAAEQLWEQARQSAPPDFLAHIEEDHQNREQLPAEIDSQTLEQLQQHFRQLDRDSQMAGARLGPQTIALIVLTTLAYALKPGHLYLAQKTLPQGLLTSLFVHYNLTHLALNMLALAGLSPLVELLYPKRFLWLYFLSGAVAGLAQLFITPQAHLVGASGAIMAILGARLALLLRYPNNHQLLLLLLIFGLQVVVDQEFPQLGGVAHMWGACSGFLFVLFSRPKDLSPQTAEL